MSYIDLQNVNNKSGGGEAQVAPTPFVFVYSGARASSTWFWSRLRLHSGLRCYYEVFNEGLSGMLPSHILGGGPSAWRSGHPNGPPYFAEFASLMGPQGGILGFPAEGETGSKFIGTGGIHGDLESDVQAYLSYLADRAVLDGKLPVLTCTRALGRVAGIKKSFPGYHVLLVRNLFKQWNSYSGQHRTGNAYFLNDLFQTRLSAGRDGFISYLFSFFSAQELEALPIWLERSRYDKVFCLFIALNVYLVTVARRSCDITVRVSDLDDPLYRSSIERELSRAVGAPIDLSTAGDQIDHPKYPVHQIDTCTTMIAEMVSRAMSELNATGQERKFAQCLLDEVWNEHSRFSYYFSADAHEAALSNQQLADTQRSTINSLEEELANAQRTSRHIDAVVAILEERLQEQELVKAALEEKLQESESLRTKEAAGYSGIAESLRTEIELRSSEVGRANADLAQHALVLADVTRERDLLRERLQSKTTLSWRRLIMPISRLARRFGRPTRE
jgi:hypothetical protein